MDTAVAINGPKDCTVIDAGDGQPGIERGHRTVQCSAMRDTDLAPRTILVGLRSPERDDQSLAHTLDVGAIEPGQFGPPETARKAEQEQCPIASVLYRPTDAVERKQQVLTNQRPSLLLGRSARPLDAPEGRADDFRSAGVRDASGFMRLGKCGDTANQGRNAQHIGIGSKVGCDAARRRRNTAAPCLEVRKVRLVRTPRVIGNAVGDEVSNPFDDKVYAINCTRLCGLNNGPCDS
jgi:hypothetical protein